MSKLYDISNKYTEFMQLEDQFDPDTFKDTLESIEGEFEDKAENIIKMLKTFNADIDHIDVESKRLALRKKAIKARHDGLKEYLRQNMLKMKIQRVDNPLFTLSLRKGSQSVFVADVGKLPKTLTFKTITADKKAIKARLDAGKKVPGCEMLTGESSLIIK